MLFPASFQCTAGEEAAFHSITISSSDELSEASTKCKSRSSQYSGKKETYQQTSLGKESWQNSNAKEEHTGGGSRDGLQGRNLATLPGHVGIVLEKPKLSWSFDLHVKGNK